MIRFAMIAMVLALCGACGGDDGGADAALDANLPDASDVDAALPEASVSDADLPDAPVGEGGAPDSSVPDSGDAAVSLVEAHLEEAVAYINCMPIIAPDPFIAWFTLVIDNSAGGEPVNARITEATLSLAGGEALDLTFDVETAMASAGGVSRTMHRKSSSTPTVDTPCARLCGTAATLRITVDLGGGITVMLESEHMLSCPV